MNLLRFVWWMISYPREADRVIADAAEWATATLAEMKRRDSGFSLLETLIVLAILGLLIGVVALGIRAA